jgi:hypothetical protein
MGGLSPEDRIDLNGIDDKSQDPPHLPPDRRVLNEMLLQITSKTGSGESRNGNPSPISGMLTLLPSTPDPGGCPGALLRDPGTPFADDSLASETMTNDQ